MERNSRLCVRRIGVAVAVAAAVLTPVTPAEPTSPTGPPAQWPRWCVANAVVGRSRAKAGYFGVYVKVISYYQAIEQQIGAGQARQRQIRIASL
jgi:hypothetical protein